MKIYLLVKPTVSQDWNDAICGVFSSLEKAKDAYPGDYQERAPDYWEKPDGFVNVGILEYAVDVVEAQKTE